MANKDDLQEWIVDALRQEDGEATVLVVSKRVWEAHAQDLQASGDLFFTWQYDIRWAAQKLRDAGVLEPKHGARRGTWRLAGW